MGRFTVILQSQPEKFYRKTDPKTARLLEKCFRKIENNPFYQARRIKKLKGIYDMTYRYRVGSLRVVYEIDVERNEVGVLAILSRGDVYKKFN